MKFKESHLAHQYLDGLTGIEIGGSAHNSFGLNTKNVDICDSLNTVYKREEKKQCGEVLAVDIVAPGDQLPIEDESIDFVINSHVLEHFFDPIKALQEWYRVIKEGGYVYMIVPHKERTFDKERERTSLSELINRHEMSSDVGIISDPGLSNDYDGEDRSDMHFSVWITEDVVELIEYLGWSIIAVQDVDDKVGNGFTVVVKKEKVQNSKQRVFLFSTTPGSGSYYYRANVFSKYSHQYNVCSNVDVTSGCLRSNGYVAQKIESADIVVFLRPHDTKYLPLLELLKLSGKIVLTDNDDDFSSIDINNPAYHLVGADSITNSLFIERSNGVIGSTKLLAEKMRDINVNVECVPNLIDFDEFSAVVSGSPEKSDARVRIGITGSAATLENMGGFINTLQNIKETFEHIEFVFFSDSGSLDSLKEWFPDHSEFIKHVTFQNYAEKLASLRIDIALIPRADNVFNRYKSNCKYLEYGALGIPVIAQGFSTKDGPYELTIENGITGFIAIEDSDWIESIAYLMDGRARQEIADNASKYIKKTFSIKNSYQQWDNAVATLSNRSSGVVESEIGCFNKAFYLFIFEQLMNPYELEIVNQRNETIKEQTSAIQLRNKSIEEKITIIKKRDEEIRHMKLTKVWRARSRFIHIKNKLLSRVN